MRRIVRVLLPPAVVALILAVLVQVPAVRRLAVRLLDQTPAPAAAASAERIEPTIDGPDRGRPTIRVILEPVITGVPQPTDLQPVPGHPDKVVVLSKAGTAYLATPGGPAKPWFTVDVVTTSELGLLGIAFHPKFTTNGLFFVDATPAGGSTGFVTRILRGHVDPATLASPTIGAVVLDVEQPYQNHDAGQILFGPDGMLYVSLGDGGYRNDPHGHGQNLGTLLGSMLRIDVDRGEPYTVPPDNPFVDRPGARPEIWAYGLRNPWRFTFDPRGRMIVGDVGQNRLEEIDLVAKGDNLGWRIREAELCFDPETNSWSSPSGLRNSWSSPSGLRNCPTAGLVDPIWSYPREEGVSVTGGLVWTAPGPLSGKYLFGDFGSGRLWALDLPAERRRVDQVTALGRFPISPSTFGRAPDGSVWVADFHRGAVYAVVPR